MSTFSRNKRGAMPAVGAGISVADMEGTEMQIGSLQLYNKEYNGLSLHSIDVDVSCRRTSNRLTFLLKPKHHGGTADHKGLLKRAAVINLVVPDPRGAPGYSVICAGWEEEDGFAEAAQGRFQSGSAVIAGFGDYKTIGAIHAPDEVLGNVFLSTVHKLRFKYDFAAYDVLMRDTREHSEMLFLLAGLDQHWIPACETTRCAFLVLERPGEKPCKVGLSEKEREELQVHPESIAKILPELYERDDGLRIPRAPSVLNLQLDGKTVRKYEIVPTTNHGVGDQTCQYNFRITSQGGATTKRVDVECGIVVSKYQ